MNEPDVENNKPILLKYSFSLLLSIVAAGLIFVMYGFYWSDSEKIVASILQGSLVSPPYEAWFDEALLFQVPVIAFLSNCFEKIPVYGIGSIIVIVIYMSLWIHLAIRLLARQIRNNLLSLILLSILFVYSIIGICLVYGNVSIESMLLASGALFLYLDYYLFEQRKPIPLVLLFLFGCLIRVSSGGLVLIAFTLFYWLLFRNIKKTMDLLKIQWMLVIIWLLITQVYKSSSNNPGLQVQQFYEYAMQDRGDVIPLSEMKSRMDSMRYIALTNYFLISDSAQIKLDFIKRVADTKRYIYFGINREDISHLSDCLPPLLVSHGVLFILLYLLLIAAAWNCDKTTIVNILAINLFGWLIVAVISMKINMVDHFLLPWVSILSGCSLYFVSLKEGKFRKLQKVIVVSMLLAIVKVVSGELYEVKKMEAIKNSNTYSNLKRLAILSTTSVPVMWDNSQAYFPTDILQRQHPDILKNCIYLSAYSIMYFKFAQKRCLEKFGFSPLDWRSMNISFHKNHEKVKFVTQPNIADFLGAYYKTLYNLDFKLVKDEPANEIVPEHFVYHLEVVDSASK